MECAGRPLHQADIFHCTDMAVLFACYWHTSGFVHGTSLSDAGKDSFHMLLAGVPFT